MAGFDGYSVARGAGVAGARVLARRPHLLRAQRRGARAGGGGGAGRRASSSSRCRRGWPSIRKAAASRASSAPFTEWPPMATLGRSGDPALARRFATALAAELRAVGITLDFAPVLDILTNPKNPVIGDRALAVGRRAGVVARRGDHRDAAGSGPGRVRQALPGPRRHPRRLASRPADRRARAPRLREVEFVPFRAAIEAGVASLMTAHVLVPAFDEAQPATLSTTIVQRDAAGRARLRRAWSSPTTWR